MKRVPLLLGLLLVLGSTTARAQTHVNLSIGFGVPAYVPTVVVVERPFFYRPPVVVVVARPYPVGGLFVERVIVARRPHYHYRPYHRVRACGYYRCGY